MKKIILFIAMFSVYSIQTANAAQWSTTTGTMYSWEDAYRHCANMRAAGRSDWRLPTALELNDRYKNSMSKPAWNPNGSQIDWLWSISKKDGGPYFLVNVNNGARSWDNNRRAFLTCVSDSTIDPNSWLEDADGAKKIKDWARVVKIIAPEAKKNNPEALVFLGKLTFDGTGVQKNEDEAFKLYMAAAKQGQAIGQLSIAALYELGRGTGKDIKSAIYWYEKAAAQNEPGAADAAARLRNAR
ncbi:Lcl domain-containing protein [Pseudoduganella namucuonensis]|nr:DUF1566 domain-containing protein [Pseudoduganella namucuonensis]